MPAKKSAPTDSVDQPELRILKKGSCPSVSGKSVLHYSVGADSNGAIHVQVTSNSGSGMYSKRWVPLADIRKALGSGGPITAIRLAPLTRGRSANDRAFLLAILKAEGLIRTTPDKQRVHELVEGSDFDARLARLSGSSPEQTKPTGKAAPKPTAPSKSKPAGKAKPTRRK